jgi:hypothetical protein
MRGGGTGPDETRQPSTIFVEMVPIPTKLFALADERKDPTYNPFCLFAERVFYCFPVGFANGILSRLIHSILINLIRQRKQGYEK